MKALPNGIKNTLKQQEKAVRKNVPYIMTVLSEFYDRMNRLLFLKPFCLLENYRPENLAYFFLDSS